VLVHAPAELAPERDLVVGIDRGVVGDDEASPPDSAPGREDRADTTARELQLPVDPGGLPGAVVGIEPTGDVGAQKTVLDRKRTEEERLEDRISK
jgi:hypothetical protein